MVIIFDDSQMRKFGQLLRSVHAFGHADVFCAGTACRFSVYGIVAEIDGFLGEQLQLLQCVVDAFRRGFRCSHFRQPHYTVEQLFHVVHGESLVDGDRLLGGNNGASDACCFKPFYKIKSIFEKSGFAAIWGRQIALNSMRSCRQRS